MEIITSRANPRVVALCKLRDRKYRDRARQFLLDGVKLFDEAIACGVELTGIYVSEHFLAQNPDFYEKYHPCVVSDGVFEKMSEENAPQGVICSAKYLDFFHKFVTIYNICGEMPETGDENSVFAAYQVRDPGNLGNMIRTANAFGIRDLILGDCADIYNPKTVRAAMGALFRQRITVCSDMEGTVDALQQNGVSVFAAALDRSAVRLDRLAQDSSRCFLVGNEGHGLPDSLIEHCRGTVFIPMAPQSESLNASTAASILMWHCRRV